MPDAGWPRLVAAGLKPAARSACLPAQEETNRSHATPWNDSVDPRTWLTRTYRVARIQVRTNYILHVTVRKPPGHRVGYWQSP